MTSNPDTPQDPNGFELQDDGTVTSAPQDQTPQKIDCSKCGAEDVPNWNGKGLCIKCTRDEVLNLLDQTQADDTLTITCGNCYQEKDVDRFRIGSELKQFYNAHKTRIGRTYCKMEDLCIRYKVVRFSAHFDKLIDQYADQRAIEVLEELWQARAKDGLKLLNYEQAEWVVQKQTSLIQAKRLNLTKEK